MTNRITMISARVRSAINSCSSAKLVWLAGMSLLAASCADDKPLNTFEDAGPRARGINELMMFIWPIMGIVFVLVVGGAIVLAFKNRVDPDTYDPEDLPKQIHGNTKLEWAWTAAPALLLGAISFPMVGGIWELEEKNDPGELSVMVIGQQWWWEYRYDADNDGFFKEGADPGLPLEMILDPDDVVTANELVIPAGQQVDLELTSRDVIHSYWIPRLNGKRDTVPGRWHTWSVEADEPGKYTGWCTEYCGLSHARMRMSAIALSDDDFNTWFENQKSPAEIPTSEAALAGREIFQNQCMSCHLITEDSSKSEALDYPDDFPADVPLVSRAAPNLTHFASRSTYAGGIYGVYEGPGTDPNDDELDAAKYLQLSELAQDPVATGYRFDTAEIKLWIKNASERKAMASEPVIVKKKDPENPLGRGMLPFESLSDEQLDQVAEYLSTLD